MVLRGGIRGNGEQLSEYLISLKDNSDIQILEVDGMDYADEAYLHEIIMSMELNAELTKTDNAFFHVQINPAPGEDCLMTADKWQLAADLVAEGTDFEGQRRVIVLHTKKGRTHAHVVYERYNHETGIMIDNKFSKLKLTDNVRPKLEQALNHKPTPRRNPQRKELKEAVTELWNNTTTGNEFVTAARKAGYIIAEGTADRPFKIVDENGISHNLIRQITGVRTKEVRARLRNEKLIHEKIAIEQMREKRQSGSGKQEQEKIALKPATNKLAEAFADNRTEAVKPLTEDPQKQKAQSDFIMFKADSEIIVDKVGIETGTQEQRNQTAVETFADNKPDLIQERERQKQILIDEQKRIEQKRKRPKLKP